MKPLNIIAPRVPNKPDQKVSCQPSHPILHCLAIIGLYIPLLWYTLYLREVYPHHTNLLDMEPLHLIMVIALLIAPQFALRSLGVKWRGKESSSPEV